MFKLNQKVWCTIYGAGTVVGIRQESTTYSAIVGFDVERTVSYTSDGKYHETSNVTLFPYPVEIVKATVKPSINWSHVDEEFRYLAQDSNGMYHLYSDKPLQGERQWTTNLPYGLAKCFTSFIPGTCDWKDSLVERPD